MFVSPTHFIVAFVLWCLLFLYNWQLKTVPFLGNVIVGFLVAGSISYGALIDSTAAGGGAELKNLLNTNVLVAFVFSSLIAHIGFSVIENVFSLV